MSEVVHWPSRVRWTDDNETGHDPDFHYAYFSNFRSPGQWQVASQVYWKSCNEFARSNGSGGGSLWSMAEMIYNSTSWSTVFTIEEGGVAVDLVADTARDSCADDFGVAITVTDQVIRVPMGEAWVNGEVCAVVNHSPTPTPHADPCQISLTQPVVESMEAWWDARRCRSVNPPDHCSTDENAAQGLMMGGVFCFLVAFGAAGFLLMSL